jgi:hypothetical protein
MKRALQFFCLTENVVSRKRNRFGGANDYRELHLTIRKK